MAKGREGVFAGELPNGFWQVAGIGCRNMVIRTSSLRGCRRSIGGLDADLTPIAPLLPVLASPDTVQAIHLSDSTVRREPLRRCGRIRLESTIQPQQTIPLPPATPHQPDSSLGQRAVTLSPVALRAQALTARRLIKLLLLAHRSGWLIAGFVAALFVGAVFDYFLRSPGWVRGVGLLFAAALIGSLLVRRVLPVLRFSPSAEDLTLRLSPVATAPQAAATLAVATAPTVITGPSGSLASSLASSLVAHARHAPLIGLRSMAASLRWQPAARAAGALALAVLLVLAALAFEPRLSTTGARRMLTPWADASWPRRYLVTPMVEAEVAPLGRALVLSAALVRAPGDKRAAEVLADLVISSPGRADVRRTIVLTPQDRTASVPVPEDDDLRTFASGMDQGLVFERLLEPSLFDLPPIGGRGAAGAGEQPGRAERATLRYTLRAGDHEAAARTIELVRPPEVVRLTLRSNPPEYLRATASSESKVNRPNGVVTLGPVAEGSAVSIDIALSSSLPLPTADATGAASIAATLGQAAAALIAQGKAVLSREAQEGESGTSGKLWRLSWVPRETLVLPIRLVDAHSLTSADDLAVRLEVRGDRVPEVAIISPATDMAVTAEADVEVIAEARDDYSIAALGTTAQRAVRPGNSAGAEHELTGPGLQIAELERSATENDPAASGQVTLTGTISARMLSAKPGDEVHVVATAQDNFLLTHTGAPEMHAPVRSAVRRLRIVSAEQMTEKLAGDLAALRRAIIAATERQSTVRQAATAATKMAEAASEAASAAETEAINSEQSPAQQAEQTAAQMAAQQAASRASQQAAQKLGELGSEQAELARQIARLAEMAKQADAAARQNKLDPQAISKPAAAAAAGLQAAASKAAEAADSARAAARPPAEITKGASDAAKQATSEAAAEASKAAQRAAAQQQATERALEQAASVLDRGQDAWAARRSLAALADEQKATQQATKQAGQETQGKEPGQLTAQQRAALDQAAERQEDLARQAAELEQKLKQGAEALRTSDPAASEALRDAAQRAAKSGVQQQMQDAAKQTRANQTNEAQQKQEQAEKTLRSMMEQLDAAKANQDAVLRRQLDTLAQTIEALIAMQQAELNKLTAAIAAAAPATGLDAAMIRLNTATQSAMDNAGQASIEVVGGGENQAQKIVQLLRSAGDVQSSAIINLRARPAKLEQAAQNETESLKLLEEAKSAAAAAKQEAAERDAAERRAALRAIYQQMLADQIDLTADTAPMIGKTVDRRERMTASALATRQALLPGRLGDLREKLDQLAESGIFLIAHQRISKAAADATDLLRAGKWGPALAARQAAIERTLLALVSALADPENKSDFRENEQGEQPGQQGGGGGSTPEPLLPPITELQLLRGLQQEALLSTREADEATDPALAKQAATDAVSMQRDLSARAAEVAEKLKSQQQ